MTSTNVIQLPTNNGLPKIHL